MIKLTREHFGQAADLIETEGLSRGTYYQRGCGFCTMGSLAVVSGNATRRHEKLFWGKDGDVVATVEAMEADPLLIEFSKTLPIACGHAGYPTNAVYTWSDTSPRDGVVNKLREFAQG